jgi:hypothetical protein
MTARTQPAVQQVPTFRPGNYGSGDSARPGQSLHEPEQYLGGFRKNDSRRSAS